MIETLLNKLPVGEGMKVFIGVSAICGVSLAMTLSSELSAMPLQLCHTASLLPLAHMFQDQALAMTRWLRRGKINERSKRRRKERQRLIVSLPPMQQSSEGLTKGWR